ncbi:MAG: FHA domain-containing protein, partial [bacterium]
MSVAEHLIIEGGPERGRALVVAPEGVRLGRSSRNDYSLNDNSLSRFHCRFYFEPDEALWVADLGSSNGTLVNGEAVQECRLKVGDHVAIGNTEMRVVNAVRTISKEAVEKDGNGLQRKLSDAELPPPAVELVSSGTLPAVAVDLGLHPVPKTASPLRASPFRTVLFGLAVVMAVLALGSWVLRWLPSRQDSRDPVEAALSEPPAPIEVRYEKVEATTSNIYRYALDIQNNTLRVHSDDLTANRHLRREKRVDPELLRSLARAVAVKGFFELQGEYRGAATNACDTFDLVITLGRQTHRVRVINLVEPDAFSAVRGAVEEFGKNELGLAALALQPEELVARARESLALGKRLYEAREVRPGNLHDAIRAFQECEWYLETVDAKPDFYAEAVSGRQECERQLQKRYDDLWFQAERAVKLRDWKESSQHLRVIQELIPDRSDERNKN